MRRVKNVIRPEVSVAEIASGNSRSVKRARSVLRLRSRSQSAMKEAKSIWRSLASTGAAFEKVHLDELAELVGDAVLIGLDDRGMRDRQAQRPAKQGHHRVPVGEAADGGGFGEGRDEAEDRMQVRHHPGGDEHRERAYQHQRGQRLDPPQLGRPRGVTRGVEGEGGGNGHGGFRR